MGLLTVAANGQSLTVDLHRPGGGRPSTFSDAGLSAPITLPLAITADQDFYFPAGTNIVTVTVTTAAGVTLLSAVQHEVGDTDHVVVTPLPTAAQEAATDSAASGGSVALTAPTGLTGCEVWLDASTLALSDGAPVALWPDLTTNGYDVAQATANNQPVFKTAVQNGLGVVRFTDAVHPQFLAFSGAGLAALFNGWGSFTVAMVVKAASTNATSVVSAIGTVAGGGNERVLLNYASAATSLLAATNDTPVGPPTTLTGVNWVTAQPACLVPLVAEWDGSLPFAVIASTAGGGSDVDPSALGAAGSLPASVCSSIQIGGELITGFGQVGMNGDVGEVAVYNRALSASERRLLLEYFSDKWGSL